MSLTHNAHISLLVIAPGNRWARARPVLPMCGSVVLSFTHCQRLMINQVVVAAKARKGPAGRIEQNSLPTLEVAICGRDFEKSGAGIN